MSILEEFNERHRKKQLARHMKLVNKNAGLRAKGIEPVKKGWGTMIDTGFGGVNKANPIESSYDRAQQQKNIAKKNEKR